MVVRLSALRTGRFLPPGNTPRYTLILLIYIVGFWRYIHIHIGFVMEELNCDLEVTTTEMKKEWQPTAETFCISNIQGAYKLSEDFACVWFLPVGFRQGQCLRPTTSKDTTRIARAHQHRNRERHKRHAWEGLAGVGVSPGHLPCHTWGAHRMHLRSLWNCKHCSFKW